MECKELLFLGACALLGRRPTPVGELDSVYVRHTPLEIYAALQDAKAVLQQAKTEATMDKTT